MNQTTKTATITLTDAAKAHIQKWLKKENGNGLRLAVKKTGCSGYQYQMEIVAAAQESDIVIAACDDNDINVYIDKDSLDLLQGSAIDYVKQGHVSRLLVDNPRAKGLCGCGESFTL